jgi:hypothetical protein
MKEMIGPNPENLTMDIPCRTIFAAGQRTLEVVGPPQDQRQPQRASLTTRPHR